MSFEVEGFKIAYQKPKPDPRVKKLNDIEYRNFIEERKANFKIKNSSLNLKSDNSMSERI